METTSTTRSQEFTFQIDSRIAEFRARQWVYSNSSPGTAQHFLPSFADRSPTRGWQSRQPDQRPIAQGLNSVNHLDRIWDINPSAGGPILKDHLWIYSSWRHWGTYNTVAGSFKDKDFSEFNFSFPFNKISSTEQNLFLRCGTRAPRPRLTTQINSKNKASLWVRLAVHFFRQLLRSTYLTAISACPDYKNIPQYRRAGELERAGHQ